MELIAEEFLLGSIVDVIVSQAMIAVRERNIQLFHKTPEDIKALQVYGDKTRLQLVLSDFLLNSVHHSPSPDGWVEIKISSGLKLIKDRDELIQVQFR